MALRDLFRFGRDETVARRSKRSGGGSEQRETVQIRRADFDPPPPRPASDQPPPPPPEAHSEAPRPATPPEPAPPRPEPQRRPAAASPERSDATVYDAGPQQRGGRIVGLLVGIDGPLEGEVVKLRSNSQGEFWIGRDPANADAGPHPDECNVVVPAADQRISRLHLRMEQHDELFALFPIEGKKTLLNDVVIEEVSPLADGDTLYMGRSEFKFRTV